MAGKFDPNIHRVIIATIRQQLAKQYPHLELYLEQCDLETQRDMLRLVQDFQFEITREQQKAKRGFR